MRMLGPGEAQRPRQRIDCRDRRVHRAALLEADVPVDADAGELGHLLTPQPRGAPSPSAGKADRFRRQPLAARPQEITERDTPWVSHRTCLRSNAKVGL